MLDHLGLQGITPALQTFSPGYGAHPTLEMHERGRDDRIHARHFAVVADHDNGIGRGILPFLCARCLDHPEIIFIRTHAYLVWIAADAFAAQNIYLEAFVIHRRVALLVNDDKALVDLAQDAQHGLVDSGQRSGKRYAPADIPQQIDILGSQCLAEEVDTGGSFVSIQGMRADDPEVFCKPRLCKTREDVDHDCRYMANEECAIQTFLLLHRNFEIAQPFLREAFSFGEIGMDALGLWRAHAQAVLRSLGIILGTDQIFGIDTVTAFLPVHSTTHLRGFHYSLFVSCKGTARVNVLPTRIGVQFEVVLSVRFHHFKIYTENLLITMAYVNNNP